MVTFLIPNFSLKDRKTISKKTKTNLKKTYHLFALFKCIFPLVAPFDYPVTPHNFLGFYKM